MFEVCSVLAGTAIAVQKSKAHNEIFELPVIMDLELISICIVLCFPLPIAMQLWRNSFQIETSGNQKPLSAENSWINITHPLSREL
jgi:predicted acyltransferase